MSPISTLLQIRLERAPEITFVSFLYRTMVLSDYRRRVPFLVLLVITPLWLFNMHNKRTGTKGEVSIH